MTPAQFAHVTTQLGILATSEAAGLGITESQLMTMVRRGDLIRVHRGVYRHAAAPITSLQRLRAGLLAVGSGGVVSHRRAIAVHGARNFQCDLVELTHRSRSLPLRDGLVLHRSATLSDADIVARDGLPVTSAARTLIDATTVLPPQLVARYAQEWAADRTLRAGDLDAAIARAGNHAGARRLQPFIVDLVDTAESTGEAELGRVLARAGLRPELHVLVTTTRSDTFELDWAFPRERLGLEMDGYGIHLRSPRAFDDDRWRRNELEIDGWRILNFTTRQLRRPSFVADQVGRALASVEPVRWR